MELLCPHCRKRLTVSDDKSGQVLNCPLCNGAFAAPSLVPARRAAPSPPPRVPPPPSVPPPAPSVLWPGNQVARHDMYCVEISARIISWPAVCACCCRPRDTVIEVSSTRTTGKRVIHTETKSWNIPYCNKCLGHITAARNLQRFSMFVLHISALAILSGLLLAFLVYVLCAPGSLGWAIGLSMLVAALTAAGVAWSFRWCHEKYARDVEAKRVKREELQRVLDSLLCPACVTTDEVAARYDGWSGTIHTFYFTNFSFASLFRSSNPGKCLEDGQIHH